MVGLGWIEKDTACYKDFASDLGEGITWNSPKTGTVDTDVQALDGFEQAFDALFSESTAADGEEESTNIFVPAHDHDSSTDGGLIAVCVIVWIISLVLIIVLIYQYMQEKKNGGAGNRM